MKKIKETMLKNRVKFIINSAHISAQILYLIYSRYSKVHDWPLIVQMDSLFSNDLPLN